MVGTTIIGDSVVNDDTLPPEARALNRYFRLLEDSQVIRQAFLATLDAAAAVEGNGRLGPPLEMVDRIRNYFEASFCRLLVFEGRSAKTFEERLAKSINAVISHVFETEDALDESSLGSTMGRLGDGGHSSMFTHDDKATSEQTEASFAFVSDASETMAEPKDGASSITQAAFWTMLLEGMHLQVVSRTIRVWGRKKIYEIYRLNGVAGGSPELIRTVVEKEFASLFGGLDNQRRSYAMEREGYLYVMLYIGKPYDYQDENNRAQSGEKKKKAGNEFVFIVKPGSSLMAVSASRAPSRSIYSKYALTAVDIALSRDNSAKDVVYELPKRVGDYNGTDPMELLKAAYSADTGQASGRYATLASQDPAQQDPLTELVDVSTRSVVDRSLEKTRLAVSARHGREVGQESALVAVAAASESHTTSTSGGGGSAALSMSSARGIVVDHEATCKQKVALKRSRRIGQHEFGDDDEGGRPMRKLKLTWSGETNATSKCWGIPSCTTKTATKCCLSFTGENVIEGIRELIDMGLIQASSSDFMRDVVTLNCSTITVQDGVIVPDKSR